MCQEDSPPHTPLSLVEHGLQLDRPRYNLKPHISNLPTWLYILSFAPPIPSPFRHPREFAGNPKILYMVGSIAACIAGLGLPAFDIVTGWWTNYVNKDDLPSNLVLTRGSQAGYILTIVGVVYVLSFTLFMTCCKCHMLRIESVLW